MNDIFKNTETMQENEHPRFYTAESVMRGHPDKLCDLIADSVLDACLQHDPASRVACEVMATHGHIIVAGEIRFLQEQANSARQTARDDVQRLAKQRHNLTRIHTLGYIDNAQFLERSIALDQQLREKKKFLSKRTTDNSFERVLFQTRSIQQQLESSPPLETFDGTIFTKLVNRVQVSPTTIEFKFMNGMTLSEKRSSL